MNPRMKSTYQLIAILLLILAICLSDNLWAQFKIGNLSVSEQMFNKYLIDCYKYPDTIKSKSKYDFIECENCALPQSSFDNAKRMADEFNENLKKNNIGGVTDTVYFKAYNDTLWDGVLWASSGMEYIKKHAKKITVEHIEAGFYLDWKGYLMPRKPTEEDFIKWQRKGITKQYHIQKMDSTDCFYNWVSPSDYKNDYEVIRITESKDIYYTDRDFKRRKKLIATNIN